MRKGKKVDSVSTFLGPGDSIEGAVEFVGTIRVDGNVRGKIFSSNGTLIIGEKSFINAEINVDVAIIMGEVNGSIEARDRIEIYPPGRVVGDMRAPVMSIEAGVMFNGNCAMKARTISSGKPVKSSKIVTDKAKRK